MYICIVASQVGKFLKTSGILKHIEKTWTTLKFYWSAGHKAIKDSSPEYYKAVVDLCTPYIKLAGDVCLAVRNISVKLYNNTAAYVERNIPIVLDRVSITKVSNLFVHNSFMHLMIIFMILFYIDRTLCSRNHGANKISESSGIRICESFPHFTWRESC